MSTTGSTSGPSSPPTTSKTRAGAGTRDLAVGVTPTPRPISSPSKSTQKLLAELRARLLEVSDLNRANSVLNWDQSTYMPAGGGAARGRQQALLSRLAHERFTDKALGRLLDRLGPATADLDPDSDDACLVRVARRGYDRAIKVPTELVELWSAHGSKCYQTWVQARPDNDFAAVRDGLEVSLDHARTWAGFFGPGQGPEPHAADPFIDAGDEGMTVASVRALFAALRAELVPLARAITSQEAAASRPAHRL
jgi:carboxypeptidase Taq